MNDSLWLLICSFLVFLMQPGFMCLEAGLTRSKNSIHVAMKNLVDFCLSIFLFWALGYGLMFGHSISGVIGTNNFLLTVATDVELIRFFLFQAMFCSTATTIVSGAVAERMNFNAYLIVSALASTLIYSFFGHWAWNQSATTSGWLAFYGFTDFAGATVVHSIGGWIALATLLVIGPRLGRFPENAPPNKMNGSNLPLSVLGTMLLWLGWLGFNGGSTFEFNDQIFYYSQNLFGGGGWWLNGSLLCLATPPSTRANRSDQWHLSWFGINYSRM